MTDAQRDRQRAPEMIMMLEKKEKAGAACVPEKKKGETDGRSTLHAGRTCPGPESSFVDSRGHKAYIYTSSCKYFGSFNDAIGNVELESEDSRDQFTCY